RRPLPAAAGRVAGAAARAVPHPGLLSADRCGGIGSRRPGCDHRGNGGRNAVRALRPPDRPCRGRFDGKEEARGLLLMRAAEPGFLRVVACGSVDDGKSTLIGRLLFEAGRVPDDERIALARASAAHGTRGEDIDYALLLDGLEAEREQGITIDVAWRHLQTP